MDLRIDKISFWLGFLAGGLVIYIATRFRPLFNDLREILKQRAQNLRAGISVGIEQRYRQDVARMALESPIVSSLFSLDEIAFPPRLQAPPPYVVPDQSLPPDDVYSLTIPYIPDWPELAAVYNAPTMTLPEALADGANLAIFGIPGSGKTFALNYLAAQLARRNPEMGNLVAYIPVLVHAADLDLPGDPENLTNTLYTALYERVSTLVEAQLPKFLETILTQEMAFLIVDGLDELAPEAQNQVVAYLKALQQAYPGNRLVIAASESNLPGIQLLDLFPIAMASWDRTKARTFIEKWKGLWEEHVVREGWAKQLPPKVESWIINGWLFHETTMVSPLDLTLKVWAAYAGDALGPTPADAIDAYIHRMTVDVDNARPAMERLAAQIVLTQEAVLPRNQAGEFVAQFEDPDASSEVDIMEEGEKAVSSRAVKRMLPEMVKNNVLVNRANSKVSFGNPVVLGYLAACGIAKIGGGLELLKQPDWTGKRLALEYLATKVDVSAMVNSLLGKQRDDVLQKALLSTGRWTRSAPKKATWRANVMRSLAGVINNQRLPLAVRGRALAALASSTDPIVHSLFQQLLKSEHAEVRQLGALGAGAVQDEKTLHVLEQMLHDPAPSVNRAACLALVAMDTKQSVQKASEALVHGNEDVQRAAAEALAHNPIDGHPLLREGARAEEDLLVRRAVVYGLAQVKEDWAIDLLREIQVEDSQWVVRSAAGEAIDQLVGLNPNAPKDLPPLADTPWLIAFAAERGMGVAPGQGAWDMLKTALKEGTPDQQLAAMYHYRLAPDEAKGVIPDLYKLMYGNDIELREAATNTLWHVQAAGIELPPPGVFGIA
ncbi:MAG: HEAT repeat domain-containing protein [Anaerolineales bacterium]|nr:HEAT repeat domain-containing protein [Anaerolineales bacterium]